MRIMRRSLAFVLSLFFFSSCSSNHIEDIIEITIDSADNQDKDSTKSYFKLDYYFSLNRGGNYTQGGAIFGDYLFQVTTGSELHVYNFTEKEFVTTIKLPIAGHADTMCFGVEKVNEDDEFPALYISGQNVNKPGSQGDIYVYRISKYIDDLGVENWKGELVQCIKTPDVAVVGYYPDVVIDSNNNCMWMMGWFSQMEYNVYDGSGCTNIFSKFPIPSITDGTKDKNGVYQFAMTEESRLSYFMTYDMHAIQQGLCFYNGIIVCPYGGPSVKYKGIDFIDTNKQMVFANINLAGSIIYEAEASFVYKDELYLLGQNDYVYKCFGMDMRNLCEQ